MDSTGYWKTVSPHIRQIKLATTEYLETILAELKENERGKVYTSLELFNFVERFHDVMGDISDTAYRLANQLFLANLHSIQANVPLEFPRRKFKRFLRVVKGGENDAAVPPQDQ